MITAGNTFDSHSTSSGYTWSFWIKISSQGAAKTYDIIYADTFDFWMHIDTTGAPTYNYIEIETSMGGGSDMLYDGHINDGSPNASVFTLNTWYHVVYTQLENNHKLYINGSLVCEHTGFGTGIGTISAGNLYLVSANNDDPEVYMDEASFWTKNLSAAEVQEIYNSGSPADLNSHSAFDYLSMWWMMGDQDPDLDAAGLTITDRIGGFDLLLNTKTWGRVVDTPP